MRKITLTCPDGEETYSLVWFENENHAEIDGVVDQILAILNQYNDQQFQQAVVV